MTSYTKEFYRQLVLDIYTFNLELNNLREDPDAQYAEAQFYMDEIAGAINTLINFRPIEFQTKLLELVEEANLDIIGAH